MAKLALQKHDADIMKAVEDLLASGNTRKNLENFDCNKLYYYNMYLLIPTKNILDEVIEIFKEEVEEAKLNEETQLKEEAFARLSEDMLMVDDDHLDLTLQKEEEFLYKYLSLLKQD